ncbi:hypothetical protein [Mangrovibacterium diazotrophicum]|uniref:Uncharacterized protein n=1 Tax=Mangrovibacterium diazotrophicum TaxID=1261403 RepID=A0A419WBJ3_9BACT|nr:hypothetical protein [Mangrovibacterium diazotrophicum]RKD92819.1 hypothetical protein BC643_3196 [Mangrovibacterium diazotrophicum]
MKTYAKTLFVAATLFCATGAWAQTTDDTKQDEKPAKKHLKIVKIEDGVKTELDTVITDNGDFTWFGEGEFDEFFPGGEPPMPPDFPNDSVMRKHMKHFRFEGPDGQRREVFMHRGPGEFEAMREFKFQDGDSTHHMMFIHKGERGDDFMSFRGPDMQRPPRAMHVKQMQRMDKSNLIDLNDPDIISFTKKDMSDGREKIEIIRKKPTKKKVEVETEVQVETGKTK